MYRGDAQWAIAANAQVAESDEGGAKALMALQLSCARYDVVFERKC